MRKYLALILLFLASPTYAQVAQNQILPSVYFGDGVVVSTSTSPTAKLGAMATSSLGLPTFPDLLSYLTLSAWYATTTDALDEGSTNLYYTLARWASALAGTTTDALAEGSTNQYFTTARARSALSATYPILYNSSTGVISTDISTTTIQHNSLAGLQGGTTNEYYHLTSANASLVNNLDTDLATFSLPANTTISTYGKTLVDDANSTLAVQTLGLDTDLQTMVLQPNLTIATGTVNSLTYYSGENTLSGISTSSLGINTDNIIQGSTNLFNQTHTGEVTGATALTVTDNVIDEANLKINTATDNYILTASSTASGGIAWSPSSAVVSNVALSQLAEIGTGILGNPTTLTGTPSLITSAGNGSVLRTAGSGGGQPSFGQVNIADADAITGTLPVGNGGTGITALGSGIATWLGTPSSANLATAVTDETGSGVLVFGTSPAFTTGLSTPAITTASGALTVTPAAGSNLNVALSTTGDFAVNTDDFYVDTSTARIGVGTAAPTQVFDIETNENANSIFLLKNASSTAASAAGVIRVSGDTALTQVIAHGSGRTISRYGITLGGYSEIAPSAGNGLIIGTINATPLIFGTSGQVNTTEAMRITTDNRIGIGETAPATNIEVNSPSGTTTMQMLSTTASVGSRIILEDVDGAGCTEITTLNGTITGRIVTCL